MYDFDEQYFADQGCDKLSRTPLSAMTRFLHWLQNLPNRLRDWEKRHCVASRAESGVRAVLVEFKWFWCTVLGFLAAYLLPLAFTNGAEHHIEGAGTLLQIFGVITVAD